MSEQDNLPVPTTPTADPAALQTAATGDVATATQAPAPAAGAPPVAAPQNQPHPLASALNSVLKGATGGDVYYTAPDGTRKLAPQSSGTLGKTLIAATLAGLLAKDDYRQTSYGPVRDFSGTGANAVAASKGVMDEMRNRPQKLSDEMQTKKMMTIQNNASLIALRSASARLNHSNEAEQSASDTTGFQPFKDYEDLRTSNNDPSQPKAFLNPSATSKEVFASGHKLTDSNVVPTGEWVSKWNDDTKQMEREPLYAVLNPDLKDINLPKDVTDMLNKINSQWKDIHAITGGNVKIPVNAYVSAMHDYSAVTTGTEILNQLNTAVNGKDAKPLTSDAVAAAARAGRDGKKDILPALYQLAHGVAGNNVPDKRPDNLLDVLLHSPNGDKVLDLIGMTPDGAMKKAESINAERTKQMALAKLGGIGTKAPAPEGAAAKQIAMIDASDLDQTSKDNLKDAIPEFSGGQSTMGQLTANSKTIESAIAAKNRNDIQTGQPAALKTAVGNMIEGDNTSIKDMVNARSGVRTTANNMLQQEARDRGLDPSRFNLTAQESKAAVYKNYSEPEAKIGQQIQSFGKLLGHINDGYEASQAWARSGSPLFNKPIKWLAENAQNDQDYQRFQTSMIAPAKEYMNFLNQNRAEHESDIKALEPITNGTASPSTTVTILKELARTADIQSAQLGRNYLQTVGTTYPVVDPTGTAILERLLGKGKSQAAAVSAQIPRGWQGGKAQPLTDPKLMQTIWDAAGHDKTLAIRIAKENGWNDSK